MAALIPRQADAAAIVLFDSCSEASLCNQLTITTTLNGTAIDVVVDSVSPGFGIFGQTGASRAFGFNVNGSGVAITNIAPFSSFSLNENLGGGFGFFEFVINGPQQGANAVLPLSFTVARTGGFMSEFDLFETNVAGYIAAAHLRNNQTGVTGFVAANDISVIPVIPEPATILLFGTGLLAAARAARRRRT